MYIIAVSFLFTAVFIVVSLAFVAVITLYARWREAQRRAYYEHLNKLHQEGELK